MLIDGTDTNDVDFTLGGLEFRQQTCVDYYNKIIVKIGFHKGKIKKSKCGARRILVRYIIDPDDHKAIKTQCGRFNSHEDAGVFHTHMIDFIDTDGKPAVYIRLYENINGNVLIGSNDYMGSILWKHTSDDKTVDICPIIYMKGSKVVAIDTSVDSTNVPLYVLDLRLMEYPILRHRNDTESSSFNVYISDIPDNPIKQWMKDHSEDKDYIKTRVLKDRLRMVKNICKKTNKYNDLFGKIDINKEL